MFFIIRPIDHLNKSKLSKYPSILTLYKDGLPLSKSKHFCATPTGLFQLLCWMTLLHGRVQTIGNRGAGFLQLCNSLLNFNLSNTFKILIWQAVVKIGYYSSANKVSGLNTEE